MFQSAFRRNGSFLAAAVIASAGWHSSLRAQTPTGAYAWGLNESGQCEIPTCPPGVHYTRLSGGLDFGVGLRSDGQIVAWGRNGLGQCNVPALPPGQTYTWVDAGPFCAAAVRSDGSIVQWGALLQPAPPPAVQHVSCDISADVGIALRGDGQVTAWGYSAPVRDNIPALPPGMTYVAVAAQNSNVGALRSDGQIVTWGENSSYFGSVPALPSGVTYTSIAAGYNRYLATCSDGSFRQWPPQGAGYDIPQPPAGLRYTSFASCCQHWVAMRSDGQVIYAGSTSYNERERESLPLGAVLFGGYHQTYAVASIDINLDCNTNGISDYWDCIGGLASDMNWDQLPDLCQDSINCNLNQYSDAYEAPPARANTGSMCRFLGGPRAAFVDWSASVNPSTMTVELWAKCDGGSGWRCPISARGAFPAYTGYPVEGYGIYVSPDNYWEFWARGGSSWHAVRGPVMVAGEWIHLAAVCSGTVISLYANGQLFQTTTFGRSFSPVRFSCCSIGSFYFRPPLVFGAEAVDTFDLSCRVGSFFTGYIDEVRIWSSARTDEEIAANYDAVLSGTETGLEGMWRFENSGSLRVDDLAPLGGAADAHRDPGSASICVAATSCAPDSNHNGVLDPLDIANGVSRDCNTDGIADEVQHLSLPSNFDGSASIAFDGMYQYVEVPYDPAINPASMTVEFWCKFTGTLGEGSHKSALASRSSTWNFYELSGFTFYIDPSDQWLVLIGQGGDASWTALIGPTVQPGAWMHLAITCDAASNIVTFFVNGAAVASASDFHYQPNQNAPLRIAAGTTEESPRYHFPGQIDDVRIWNHARSQAEIAQAMNERMNGSESGLVALYQLDEGVGSLAANSAASTAGIGDGMLYNDPIWMAAVVCSPCSYLHSAPGDMNGDAHVDGRDVQRFVDAVIAGELPAAGTCAADLNRDGLIDSTDVLLMNMALLQGQ